jgi:hypothetical protein
MRTALKELPGPMFWIFSREKYSGTCEISISKSEKLGLHDAVCSDWGGPRDL